MIRYNSKSAVLTTGLAGLPRQAFSLGGGATGAGVTLFSDSESSRSLLLVLPPPVLLGPGGPLKRKRATYKNRNSESKKLMAGFKLNSESTKQQN